MKLIVKVAFEGTPAERTYYTMWCPACQDIVMIDNKWEFDGNVEKPTFSPSLLTWLDPNPKADPKHDPTGKFRNGFRCHSFIKNGQWQFLGDCTHAMAGQTVDMVDIPEKYVTA